MVLNLLQDSWFPFRRFWWQIADWFNKYQNHLLILNFFIIEQLHFPLRQFWVVNFLSLNLFQEFFMFCFRWLGHHLLHRRLNFWVFLHGLRIWLSCLGNYLPLQQPLQPFGHQNRPSFWHWRVQYFVPFCGWKNQHAHNRSEPCEDAIIPGHL